MDRKLTRLLIFCLLIGAALVANAFFGGKILNAVGLPFIFAMPWIILILEALWIILVIIGFQSYGRRALWLLISAPLVLFPYTIRVLVRAFTSS